MANALGTVTHQASCRASTPINPCQDVGNVELVSYTAGGIICNTSSFVMSWKWRSRATLIRTTMWTRSRLHSSCSLH